MTLKLDTERNDSTTIVDDVTHQHALDLIGVPTGPLWLNWTVRSTTSGLTQLAYEIQVAGPAGFGLSSESSGVTIGADSIAILAPGGDLSSREVRLVRVRIATSLGWTDWSRALTVEAGLGSAADWSAIAIGIPSDVAGASPLLRREFTLPDTPVSARLRVTSLGVNLVELNGKRVGDHLLAPGWTSYHGRVMVTTHDVTAQLAAGSNAIGLALGDGWYRGRLGWEGRDSHYGDELAGLAQLEVTFADGSVAVVVTDTSWTGSFGEVRSSGIYDGTDTDLRYEQFGWSSPGFTDEGWVPVIEIPLNLDLLAPQSAPPVREVAAFELEPVASSPGRVLDAGQNIAGWVRLVVSGNRGQTVTVRHAEVLEPDGSLHTRSLRSARATDTYILGRDGESTLEPAFTFHGFRYVSVETEADLISSKAIAISSDTPRRGLFECSEPALNQLHNNVLWSQRDNFVSVPTDCPQRDERLGWTGDAQAFAPTANTIFDTESFWRSWLVDLELDQAPDGGVASVVPNILGPDAFSLDGVGQNLFGRAGWADAATIVPWSIYQSFGTKEPLRQQLSSMRRWVDWLDAHRGGEPLLPEEFQFGDWLDPDAPAAQPWAAKVDAGFVANAFFAHSAAILAQSETLVGEASRAAHYWSLSRQVSDASWARWGAHAITTQTGCALALEFAIAPEFEREAIAAGLAANVRSEHGRIATGFLGTPLVLHALSAFGYVDEAYLMLLRRDVPSWLYQVDMGATTVWERWDALAPDGSIHSGDMANDEDAQMLSFNHYAYGAVADWLYRTVAGLAIDPKDPGYRTIVVAPRPTASVTWAKAAINTRLGTVSIDWHLDRAGELEIVLVVPFGSQAHLDLALTADSTVSTPRVLGHGTHRIRATSPMVASV